MERDVEKLGRRFTVLESLGDDAQRKRLDAGECLGTVLAVAEQSLPFVQAYAVLNDALVQLADEGHFVRKGILLGELLKRSRAALPWQDFALVRTGVKHRNDVAHRGKLLGRGDCWTYIDAVRVELSAWDVL